MDITGNWSDGEGFQPHIKTREPMPSEGTEVRFTQTLALPPGGYRLELIYDPLLDRKPGWSIGGGGFRLSIDGARIPLVLQSSADGRTSTAALDFEVAAGRPGKGERRGVELALSLPNTRVMRTLLAADQPLPPTGRFLAVRPAGGGVEPRPGGGVEPRPLEGEAVLCHGIPFLMRRLDIRHIPPYIHHKGRVVEDRGSLAPWAGPSAATGTSAATAGPSAATGAGMRLDCGGVRPRLAHFLGMIHNLDIANGSWYSPKGDHGYSHFVGDIAGEIAIQWNDGGETRIPLVFGFNLWYCKAWDNLWHYVDYAPGRGGANFDASLFKGHDEHRRTIQDGLALVDGYRLMGSDSCNARFIFSVDLGGRGVQSIAVTGVPELYDYPLISAITLEGCVGPAPSPLLAPLPDLAEAGTGLRPIAIKSIERGAWRPGVEAIQRVLYTFVDDLPRLKSPSRPDGYFGPSYDFRGTQLAVYAATYLSWNGPECAAYIADTGTGCSSSTADLALVHYTQGMGAWYERKSLFGSIENWLKLYRDRKPGGLTGSGEAWSRGIGELLRESMAFGYDKYVDSYLDWLDRCLFAESNPPHWIRIAGLGRGSEGFKTVKVGEIEEVGNRENDGHGICMWGRYLIWHWKGRPMEWNRRRFPATRAAVEWIQWQLDTDTLRPGVRKDVLYTESECAHGDYDIYSTYNCLHGIKLSIRMARALGEDDLAERWERLARRLRQGILEHLVDQSPEGPIWHTEETCDWQDHAHKLVHLHLATEGDSFTPLQDYATGDELEQRCLAISRNSYRFLMGGAGAHTGARAPAGAGATAGAGASTAAGGASAPPAQPNYNCLRMYGYGQGMMTQAALLLDEMNDASRFLDLLLRYCYLPRLHGWASPEGIITHRSMRYYLPVNGYMGQDSHVADSTKAVRLMLGMDDNDPDHLRLVPRYPAEWTRMAVSDYPVLTGTSRQKMAYEYEREGAKHRLRYEFERPVERLSVRLGPFSPGSAVRGAEANGEPVEPRVLDSGDSRWVWVPVTGGGTSGEVSVALG